MKGVYKIPMDNHNQGDNPAQLYSTKTKPDLFRAYAQLLVRKGLNVKPQQLVLVYAPVETYDFVAMVVEEAYAAGSGHVEVVYTDDTLLRLRYENNSIEHFEHPADWVTERANYHGRKRAACLFLDGSDPQALKGIDPKKPAAASKALAERQKEYRNALDFGHSQWCIAGVATKAWAELVFPEYDTEEAVSELWKLILKVARADGTSPQHEWEEHKKAFERRIAYLNEKKFDCLHYRNAKGTDLYVGLPEEHIWRGGGAQTQDGTFFFPNMPTEEIFTSPDFRRTQGIVYSALPLALYGNVVDDFWFKFEDGVIVDYGAQKGKEVLDKLFATDEGARRLGECALVPKESPINQSKRLFYSTLFDENASCHLATGKGFPDAFEGGLGLSMDELLQKGINDSLTHVDFMIGTDDLKIAGITAQGEEVSIFEDGSWAF